MIIKLNQIEPSIENIIDDILLTRFEISKLLRISLVTLHNLNVKGILKPTHQIGRKPLYQKSIVLK